MAQSTSEGSAASIEHSLRRPHSPFRRTGGVVHARAPDAALHHCNIYGEALRQLRFSWPALQKAWTVRLVKLVDIVDHHLLLSQWKRSCAESTITWSGINMAVAYAALAPRALSGILWDPAQTPIRADCTRGSCSQVCRPGSLAARWEYRNDPYFHMETVRAVTAYHVCTHP